MFFIHSPTFPKLVSIIWFSRNIQWCVIGIAIYASPLQGFPDSPVNFADPLGFQIIQVTSFNLRSESSWICRLCFRITVFFYQNNTLYLTDLHLFPLWLPPADLTTLPGSRHVSHAFYPKPAAYSSLGCDYFAHNPLPVLGVTSQGWRGCSISEKCQALVCFGPVSILGLSVAYFHDCVICLILITVCLNHAVCLIVKFCPVFLSKTCFHNSWYSCVFWFWLCLCCWFSFYCD